ncbi:FixH family protein [Echinicola sp. CAU 1574]|uniref:FixH family protein n=1 Tax=Echinicola arenosa TaxID=2774144 RepID=A0ABR9AEH7_9BACT|nr:FixH family protein [Echinicola arenosa]MBD8487139.1 FixH family protein [Echinicola arenosa]
MNWGTGIVLVFVGFAAVIFTMVGICMNQDDIHLVTAHYYEEEIKYQEQIEKASNTAQLEEKALEFDTRGKSLMIHLDKGDKGTLWLFRPSDARLDQKIEVVFADDLVKSISLGQLKPGYWKVKLAWERNGKSFYEEKKINI